MGMNRYFRFQYIIDENEAFLQKKKSCNKSVPNDQYVIACKIEIERTMHNPYVTKGAVFYYTEVKSGMMCLQTV